MLNININNRDKGNPEIVPTMMLLPQEQRAHHQQAHGMLLQLQQQRHK
jgi:hypothetical protein